MKKNETQFYSITYRIQNNFLKLKYGKSNKEIIKKFNTSRNSFSKNKNKTSSNYNIYKNSIISNNNSKDIPNKFEELFQSNINSFSNKNKVLSNFKQYDIDFLRRNLSKNIKSKIYKSRTLDVKNNTQIKRWLNLAPNKKQKTVKHKLLLEKYNYHKMFFQNEDFGLSSYYNKKINPSLIKKQKRYYIIKDASENFSYSLLQNLNSSQNKNNILRINNCMSIKSKKYNTPYILNNSNKLLIDYKNSKISKNKNIIKISKQDKKSKNKSENKKNNKSKEKEVMIDDNYNEYLKGISSSDSNMSKSEFKNIKDINIKAQYENCKPIKNKLYLNDKREINEDIKRLNKNKYPIKIIKNIQKLLEYKQLNSNLRKKNEANKKNILIENPFIRKKIMLEKVFQK